MSSNPILVRPRWAVKNQLALPLITQSGGKLSVRGIVEIYIAITTLLDSLFDESEGLLKKRSLAETDRLQVFRSIEFGLASLGVDGKACLLRTICELQSNPIAHSGLLGEVVTAVLTPKEGMNDFLHDYIEARQIGRIGNTTAKSCGRHYSDCPFSVFDVVKKWIKSSKREFIVNVDDELDQTNSSDRNTDSSAEISENVL
ncbi:uncharacterized protein LOC136028422 [Artemia franciscana]|uniref:uncharacterized protein LOC136028422 n=1 Tax=Artemia franciscana TaxID=6661 RepID=UPI0032DB9AA0